MQSRPILDPLTGKLVLWPMSNGEVGIVGDGRRERRVVFVSMLGSTMEEMEQLSKVITEAGISDEYNMIITGQPLQIMDPVDLMEGLRRFHGLIEDGDPHETGTTRWEHLRDVYRHTTAMAAGVNDYIATNESNLEKLARGIDEIVQYIKGQDPIANLQTVYTSKASAEDDLKMVHARLNKNAPKEGQHW